MEIAEDMQLIIFHYIKQKIYHEVINDENYENQINTDKYYKRTILNEVS